MYPNDPGIRSYGLVAWNQLLWPFDSSQIRPYETLQACASISVSKLCNFPFPCLVNFVNNLVFCFFPLKYLGLPGLTKYFVKNWGRTKFSLFYPYFRLLLHLQYMNIQKKAFLQSCRCCNIFHLQTKSPL